jgi:two-component system LytT family response regulator
MTELRVLIVDDEPLARQRLRRLLGPHQDAVVVGECADGSAALSAVRELQPNLLLLDIQMPGVDGFGVVEQLGAGSLPIVVFVTAFDQHAVHAFEACALDYLLKPISPARLGKTLDRVRSHLNILSKDVLSETKDSLPDEGVKFLVRSGARTTFISPDEIEWIEADGNYAILHVAGRNHLLRATMSSMEASLPSTFFRASRSCILNLRCVKELQSSGGSHFAVMRDSTKALVTRSIREVQKRLRSL